MATNTKGTVIYGLYLAFILLVLVFIIPQAFAAGYPWKNHAPPYDFEFNNHFDSHQQSTIKANGDLMGFLYITFTGEVIGGIPVAEHCSDSTPASECGVGWIIRGKFLGGENSPTFVYHDGDHPIWLVNSRNDIPQPGSFSHFHWLDGPQDAGGLNPGDVFSGYVIELQALDRFYFRHGGEDILIQPGIDIASHLNLVSSFPPVP